MLFKDVKVKSKDLKSLKYLRVIFKYTVGYLYNKINIFKFTTVNQLK